MIWRELYGFHGYWIYMHLWLFPILNILLLLPPIFGSFVCNNRWNREGKKYNWHFSETSLHWKKNAYLKIFFSRMHVDVLGKVYELKLWTKMVPPSLWWQWSSYPEAKAGVLLWSIQIQARQTLRRLLLNVNTLIKFGF